MLTPEQLAILATNCNIKINAVAGSGKTTTVVEYAASRPVTSKILYLAFNKSVKQEAQRRFAKKKLNNVQVETAHSLAHSYVMRRSPYKLKVNGYKTLEVVEVLNLQGNDEKHTEHVIANHINKFVTYFCNSAAEKVQQLNYLDTINEEKAQNFVKTFYSVIETKTREFLKMMKEGKIEITHDFYLKLFQLTQPKLSYDYILFDEGQDASAAMLDIFLKQKAVKVLVGDTHQQIYTWRHAVNSMDKSNFEVLLLTTSFRFSQSIADLAMKVLESKKHLGTEKGISISGVGKFLSIETKATLARSNLALLVSAINYITENRSVKNIYFEGNINSYTYADDGASLYDVLNLFNHNHAIIKDKLIKTMKDIDELEEYIEKTDDKQLAMMVELVREYGNAISDIIKKLKSLHTADIDRAKAEMIFSTVHRAKGMEYDVVYLADDFLTEEKLERLTGESKDKEKQPVDYSKLKEEINLLYVAITRTRNRLYIPESLLPKGFPPYENIIVVKSKKESNQGQSYTRNAFDNNAALSTYWWERINIANVSNRRGSAYRPWTNDLDDELLEMYDMGSSIADLADYFDRSKGAIIARLKKHGRYEDFESDY